MRGPAIPFLLDLRNGVSGFYCTGQLLGTGTGSEDTYQLVKNWGTYDNEAHQYIMDTPNIYLDGTLKTAITHYIINGDGEVVFTSNVGNGVDVTADFSPGLLMRFVDDEPGFVGFTINLWQLGQIDLIEVGS